MWDHAVGPMQFIPSTWDTWGTDGDGDGSPIRRTSTTRQPSAAAYLCAVGHDLTGPAVVARGVVVQPRRRLRRLVHAAADTYADRTR